MIELECRTCHKVWTQTCEDCAEWSAAKHTELTGHPQIRTRSISSRIESSIIRNEVRK